jgi:hypothetical protein
MQCIKRWLAGWLAGWQLGRCSMLAPIRTPEVDKPAPAGDGGSERPRPSEKPRS